MEEGERATMVFIADTIRRLKPSPETKDPLFPLAGQEYRDNVVKLFEHLEDEIKSGKHPLFKEK